MFCLFHLSSTHVKQKAVFQSLTLNLTDRRISILLSCSLRGVIWLQTSLKPGVN